MYLFSPSANGPANLARAIRFIIDRFQEDGHAPQSVISRIASTGLRVERSDHNFVVAVLGQPVLGDRYSDVLKARCVLHAGYIQQWRGWTDASLSVPGRSARQLSMFLWTDPFDSPVREPLSRGCKLAELVPDHILGDFDGDVLLSVMHVELYADVVGQDRACSRLCVNWLVVLDGGRQ